MKRLMKLSIVGLLLFLIAAAVAGELYQTEDNGIPEQAIRMRVLANSDQQQDQQIKLAVRNQLLNLLSSWTTTPNNIDQSRNLLLTNMSKMEKVVAEQLRVMGADSRFTIRLGKVLFPEKQFAGRLYPEGNYEALVITLGAGAGKNWWCVLFPPLCFVEGTNEVKATEHDESIENVKEEAKVRFWIWEKLKNWF
jgi:stage II sporulation protein R